MLVVHWLSLAVSQGDPEVELEFAFGADPASKTSGGFEDYAIGHLAMVAVMGMFFQYGLTGSAWGDRALHTKFALVEVEVRPLD